MRTRAHLPHPKLKRSMPVAARVITHDTPFWTLILKYNSENIILFYAMNKKDGGGFLWQGRQQHGESINSEAFV